jgi:hypothetical protein
MVLYPGRRGQCRSFPARDSIIYAQKLVYAKPLGKDISFDASGSSDSDGTIVSYDWHFGDGDTGSGVTVTHVYSSEGSYTVMLTVTDDETKTVTVGASGDTSIYNFEEEGV